MTVVSVSNVARHGIVSDLPEHKQPPEAWTNARNFRFIDDRAVRFSGDEQVMEPPTVAPAHVANIIALGESYWLYASAIGAGSKIYVYNSGVHTDVSNAGDYNAAGPEDWNSTIFQGIPIMNYGAGIPQYWPAIDEGTPFDDLDAWPMGLTAKVIRSYKNYLVALNTADGDGTREHRVLVSDSAEPGFLPTSWDHTDPAVDALENDLSDVNSGAIVDGMTLRDLFIIYKGESTWFMRHIGGQLIMAFDTLLQTSGLLAPRCVTPLTLTLKKTQVHFLHNGSDVGFFNGQDFESVIQRKVRKYLNANIDPQFSAKSFVVDNPSQDEAWFCYPENGMESPNMALVWNYRENTITFRDFKGAHAATGVVEAANLLTYDDFGDEDTYDSIGSIQYQDNARRKLVIADEANTHLVQADIGDTFNGTAFDSFVERSNMALVGEDREGNPMADYQSRRLVKRLWPKGRGNPFNVYIGGSEQADVAPTYGAPMVFTPGQEFNFVDPPDPLNTRLPAFKFESIDGLPFDISGYDVDIETLGEN